MERLPTMDPGVRTEVIRGVQLRQKKNGIPVLSIHYSADPDRDPETEKGAQWYQTAKGDYSSDAAWQREQEMDANAGGGERVFAVPLTTYKDAVVITDPDWRPDPRWDCVSGFDHGKVNATALLKAYVDFDSNVYFCGEYYSYLRDDWTNEVAQNVPQILQMPDIGRMRWCMADPSIYAEDQVQADGTFSSVAGTYRKHGLTILQPYRGEQSDLTFVEKVLSEYWFQLDQRKPKLYIVCRNESDRRQPGLHAWDCPNFLWEMKQAKRAELTARQLLTRNPTEKIIDRNNHLRDCAKAILFTLKKPTAVDLGEQLREQIKDLEPTSAQIAAQRFWAKHMRAKSKVVDMRAKGKMRR
jgi:hypothetical protein